jgi:exodeoxyribonuclease VII large subunit
MQDLVLTPTDFVAVLNQTLEFAYPVVSIEGELSNFRVSKGRWVYFNLKDQNASVPFFGTVDRLPGPLQDGLIVRVVGAPRLHPRFGFTLNLQSLVPVGEGALKKAAELLRAKLTAEGLFAPERKRFLPPAPRRVGLITAGSSAAYHDFIKILGERWGGLEILFSDVYVQGDQAPAQIVQAIELLNKLSNLPEVIVITRGGGSADDLAAFDDERVVRAVAASRAPTLVAVGHEVDISLAELAADVRASTPTNAAQILVPDRAHELANLNTSRQSLKRALATIYDGSIMRLVTYRETLADQITASINAEAQRLQNLRRLITLFDPKAALKRGYAIIQKGGKNIASVKKIKVGDRLSLQLHDGTIGATTTEVTNG